MRLRRNSKANSMLQSSDSVLIIEQDIITKYDEIKSFITKQPIHIEVGMGKGDFIIGMAKQFPEINFIGIEKYETVLAVALKKIDKEQLPNLKVMCVDAEHLKDIFLENSVETVYLNFSDPWPKKKHVKRRLTHENYLKLYQYILDPNGNIIMKTDNRSLFEYSLVSLNQYDMNLLDVCLDLHHSEGYETNVMTEYERKFSQKGQVIYRLEATFKEVL